ncbi:MAG: cobyric acid synthase CobQ, partial [Lachnospiraceae bacterium]|nr:cobyric acid synthase CobQ [Lachnospiraceae bacterium]
CGGYQMMGEQNSDPEGMENSGTMNGMGLLPVITTLKREKVRRQVNGTVNEMEGFFSILSGLEFDGYEIHMGESVKNGHSSNEFEISGTEEAFVLGRNKNVSGTYVHGIFDKAAIATALVTALSENKGLSVESKSCIDYKDFKEKQYDTLADILSEYLNMEEIYGMLREAHIR